MHPTCLNYKSQSDSSVSHLLMFAVKPSLVLIFNALPSLERRTLEDSRLSFFLEQSPPLAVPPFC